MTVYKQACINHPDRYTSWKCYNCARPVCPACTYHADHHRFCGLWCRLKWKYRTVFGKLHFSVEFYILFVLIILTNFVFLTALLIRPSTDDGPQFPPQGSVKTTLSDSLWFALDSTRYPYNNAISVSLELNKNYQPYLWARGKSRLLREKRGSTYYFEPVYLEQGPNRFSLRAMNSDGHSVLVDSFTVRFYSSRIEWLSKPVDRIPTNKKALALTFDAGYIDKGANQILDVLKEKGIRSTFFLTGIFINKYPQLVERIVREGHEAGNHSYTHPHLTQYAENGFHKELASVNRIFLYRQLNGTDSLFYRQTGRHLAPFWRAPFGEINRPILLWAAEMGYKHIGWSRQCDSWDWVADTSSALYRRGEDIVKHFLELEQATGLSGNIILMHIATEREKDLPYKALPALIDSLENRGYSFKKVSELMRSQ